MHEHQNGTDEFKVRPAVWLPVNLSDYAFNPCLYMLGSEAFAQHCQILILNIFFAFGHCGLVLSHLLVHDLGHERLGVGTGIIAIQR